MLIFSSEQEQIVSRVLTALEPYQKVDPAIQDNLAKFLAESPDQELYHANPLRIADKLQLSERETLNTLLIALKAGLVSLNWEVKCPICKGIDFRPKSLTDMRTYHNCLICHSTYELDADDQIRVTFSVDEQLRQLGSEADNPDFRNQIEEQYGVVSGHRMLTLQTFRDLFPRETIPPNESMLIRKVAILFTDLAGSTALYTRRGDTRAFQLVHQHFNQLFRIVDEYNGVVVKTIGDAIMAAFTIPKEAMQAAIMMHQSMAILNQRLALPPEDKLTLKIGIDVGPCISVTLNERSDYFGTIVNTAARIQATSQGNDVAVTDRMLQDAKAALAEYNCICEQKDLLLKGLDAATLVHYIKPLFSVEQEVSR